MDDILAALPANWILYLTVAQTIASAADALIPPPAAGSPWVLPRKALHLLAINFGHARNAVPSGAIPASVAEHADEVRQAAANVEHTAATLSEAASGNPEAPR